MQVFGLDPSFTNFGVAHLHFDGMSHSFINGWQIRTDTSIPDLERIEFICRALDEQIGDLDVVLGLELPFHQGQMGSKLHMLFICLLAHFKKQGRLIVALTNSQAHSLIPEARGKRKSADIKKAAIAAFTRETGISKGVKSDTAEAYFLARQGGLFAMLLDGRCQMSDLNEREREVFASQAWNPKATARKGVLYRPWISYFDYRGPGPLPDGKVQALRKESK